MWQCPHCGKSNADGFDFCWHCGTGRSGGTRPTFPPDLNDPSASDPGRSPEQRHVAEDTDEFPVNGPPREEDIEDITEDRGEESPRGRFQFGLRTLFLVNFLAAGTLGGIQMLTTDRPASDFLSPAIWPLGALGVILMAVIGDAVGRDWGIVVCSLAGGGVWGVMLGVLCLVGTGARLYLPVHLVAMGVTLAAIIVPACLRLRRGDASDEEPSTVARLLLGQQHRKNRQS